MTVLPTDKVVVVTGSRSWTDRDRIFRRLWTLPFNTAIRHGACPKGADLLADDVARQIGFRIEKVPAKWWVFGKRAGHERNRLMLTMEPRPKLVLAFWDGESPGTKDCIDQAYELGVPVEVERAAEQAALF
jgi:hypothetical protein